MPRSTTCWRSSAAKMSEATTMITLQTLAPTQSAKEARAKRGIQQGCWWQTSFRGCSTDAQVEPKGRRAATKALQVQSLAAQILPELHGFFAQLAWTPSQSPMVAQHGLVTHGPHRAKHLYNLHQVQPLGDGVDPRSVAKRRLKRHTRFTRQHRIRVGIGIGTAQRRIGKHGRQSAVKRPRAPGNRG